MENNRLSYTQYKMWTECPLRWKLSYPDGLREDVPNIHSLFGTAMHNVIQKWLIDYVYGGSSLVAQTVDLNEDLKDEMMKQFQERTVEIDEVKQFPCDKNELLEFYVDGVAILKYLQKNVNNYFNDEWVLEEIEMPIELEVRNKVTFVGYLDIVLRHKLTGLYRIIDLKTSTKGWNKWAKGDKSKTNQLLFYKKYFSKIKGVPEEYVDVEYIILKRKLWTGSKYPAHRINVFTPANKSNAMKTAMESLDTFLNAVFDESGHYKLDSIEPTPSRSSCRFCQFKDRKDLCSVGIE